MREKGVCISYIRISRVSQANPRERGGQVGKACRLLDGGMDLHVIRGSDPDNGDRPYSLEEIVQMIRATEPARARADSAGKGLGLVVDGQALGEIFREYPACQPRGSFPAIVSLFTDRVVDSIQMQKLERLKSLRCDGAGTGRARTVSAKGRCRRRSSSSRSSPRRRSWWAQHPRPAPISLLVLIHRWMMNRLA